MRTLFEKYIICWQNRIFRNSLISAILLCLCLVINLNAGRYATEIASSPVNDLFLSNIPVRDVSFLFTYGPTVFWLFIIYLGLSEPRRIPFLLKNIAIFVLVRSVFITLTHLGLYPDAISIDYSSHALSIFTFGGDLFFSGHTGGPFLMALVFSKNKKLFILFVLAAFFFGIIVLLGHLHYSIDVLAAFFITYSVYAISEKTIFKR